MSSLLTNFKPQFDNAYQEIFMKVLVGKEIANTRFKSVLSYGATLERVAYDISGVHVRDTVRGSASTIDTIQDSNELLTVNLEKEAVIQISDGEVKQAGPLNPGAVIGAKIAVLVATDLDARILYETVNAAQTFDTGDLTTGASTGVPFALDSTNTPKAVTRLPAKLKRYNIVLSNMAFVIDSTAASDLSQYLLGKQFDVVESVWANGLAGKISTAEVYVSENLTGEFLLTVGSTPTDGDTLTINGVVFTAKDTLGTGPAVAGQVLMGTSAGSGQSTTQFLINLAAAINAPSTTTVTFTALSAADASKISETAKCVATKTTTTLKVRGIGSGRMTVAKSMAQGTLTYNMIHAYYGKKGAIDLVVQDLKETDFKYPADRRATNIFTSYLAGIKTFGDGAKQFLDVWLTA